MSITAHCLIKNEEKFVEYAIRSVLPFVEKVIIFDTGSTDSTVEIINKLKKEFSDKILFEQKGECDKVRHTELRNEMIEMTKTEWFMVLDGDEVWTNRAMEEALRVLHTQKTIDCLIAPFYLCVGDVYHETKKRGKIELLGKMGYWYPRFFRIGDIHWKGDYNEDSLYRENGDIYFNKENTYFLRKKYWHMTHLIRSSVDDDVYSSGGDRKEKRRLFYFLIGKRINRSIPEVFMKDNLSISWAMSFFIFLFFLFRKCTK